MELALCSPRPPPPDTVIVIDILRRDYSLLRLEAGWAELLKAGPVLLWEVGLFVLHARYRKYHYRERIGGSWVPHETQSSQFFVLDSSKCLSNSLMFINAPSI